VQQRALATNEPNDNDWVIMVYDVDNDGAEAINGYAGVFADFDIKATDRLHDLAYTDAGLATAYMRNVLTTNRWCGVKLLTAGAGAHLACIDHERYVYPDSGLSEDMKYRIMAGQLGAAGSDRPFNWSVAVSTGPLSLPQGGSQRVAVAFVAADDSAGYLDACRRSQEWYDANVGLAEEQSLKLQASSLKLEAYPNPASNLLHVRLSSPLLTPYSLRVYDTQGRLATSQSAICNLKSEIALDLRALPSGIYLIRLTSGDKTLTQRVAIVR